MLQLDERSKKKECLTKDELSNLASFKYKPTSKNDNNDDTHSKTCSICFEDFKTTEDLNVLACLHKFHRSCITKWLKVGIFLYLN